MKTTIIRIILSALALVTAAATTVRSQPTPPRRGDGFPRVVRVVLTEDHRVLQTAATEVKRWLKRDLPVVVGGKPEKGDLVLSRISAATAAPLIRQGLTDLHNTAPESDAFQILEHEQRLWVLGSSWRGVMQGVHELTLSGALTGADGTLDHRGQFSLRYRVFSPLFRDQLYREQTSPAAVREAIRYLSLMGASHVAVTHDFSGSEIDLHNFIESKIFPKAGDAAARQRIRSHLRMVLDAAADYGLGALYDGRFLPCQGGPWIPAKKREQFLEQFPAEVLSDTGTYQGKVLCFGHPLVQAYYREVITNFLRDFPEIDLFHYLAMDNSAEFCDPVTCPRCSQVSRFAQRDRFSLFLAKTLREARPGLLLLNTSFQWDRPIYGVDQLLARQAQLPPEIGLCMSATGDSATFDRQNHETLRRARAVTARAGQIFLGRDAMHFFEDMPMEGRWFVDYPLGIFAKVRRWDALGADGFFDVRGRISAGDLHANSVACRTALLNPLADPKPTIQALSQRWFGPKAAPMVMASWQALERGQAIRSAGYSFPSSSALSEYVPWHVGKSKAKLPLPTNPGFTTKMDLQSSPERGELAASPANGWVYHEGNYAQGLDATGQSLFDAAVCFNEAAQLLEEALAQPLPDAIPDARQWLGPETLIRPQDYLRRHHSYVRGLACFDAFMGCHFKLKALFMRVEGNADTYRKQGEPWLKAYATAARSLADYLDEVTREKMFSQPIPEQWSSDVFRDLAQEVEAWLKQ